MDKEQINNNADESARAERARKLSKKYAYRTDAEELAPFYTFFGLLTIPLQIFSALFAAGGVFLFSNYFNDSFGLVVLATVGILVALEIGKRLSYTAFNKQRNSKKQSVSKTIVILCLLFACVSISSSYICAPYTVECLASAPALIDTAKINNDFEKRLAVNSQYWTKFSNESENVANEIHSKNNWHGVTSRTARPEVLAAIGRAGSYKDSLIKYSAVIAADQRTAIARAQIENEVTKQTNNNWVSSFGEWFAVASLFFELSLFLIFFWRSNYETRELKEIEYLIQDEPQTHVRTIKDQIKDKLKNVVKTDVPASLVTNKIGFHKDENETKDEQRQTERTGGRRRYSKDRKTKNEPDLGFVGRRNAVKTLHAVNVTDVYKRQRSGPRGRIQKVFI
jgi:hypothetical protein